MVVDAKNVQSVTQCFALHLKLFLCSIRSTYSNSLWMPWPTAEPPSPPREAPRSRSTHTRGRNARQVIHSIAAGKQQVLIDILVVNARTISA